MRPFDQETSAIFPKLVAWRRDFHQHPELAFEEVRTATIVANELNQLGLEVQTGVGKTGVVAVLEGEHDGPTVLVRADMDALPVQEENTAPYISQTPNKMHACGHDAHTAILLGVATLLSAKRQYLKGRVKFVFQPAEETGEGAEAMIADGVLENPKPDIALGLHVWTGFPLGEVVLTNGPTMAGAQNFTIRVTGKGGHAAEPQQTHDPIVTAAHIITAAQSIVSRNIRPIDAGVISFTQMHAGDAFNVIPPYAELRGTIRSFKPDVHQTLAERLHQVAENIAQAMGCTATVELNQLLPPLVNHDSVTEQLRQGFREISPQLHITDDGRTMGGEDMAYFLQAAPGTYFFVGASNTERGLDFPHHHPRFDIDEQVLHIGTSLLTSAVANYVWE